LFAWRTDILEEAGWSKPPDTWGELAECAKACTSGETYGLAFTSVDQKPEGFMPYYWQCGGEYVSEDGLTATIDNEAMRQSLQFCYDMLWEHEAVSPEFYEKAYKPQDEFTAGRVAMLGQYPAGGGVALDENYPELAGKWSFGNAPEGPAGNRFMHAGQSYWGAMYGTKYPNEVAQWIAFLARDEHMLECAERSGKLSGNRNVMADPLWQSNEWRKACGAALEHGHTSQYAAPVWSKLILGEPGSPLYDMYRAILFNHEDMEEWIPLTQQRMQEEIDAAL